MPRGRPRKRRPEPPPPADEIFGGVDPDLVIEDVPPMPGGEQAEPPPPELEALGMPPDDAAGIQKWNYRALTIAAALVLRDPTLSNAKRMKRFAELTSAAAKHYPEAAKADLAARLDREAEEMAGKKRARAAAKMERRPPAGGAKVIPIRPDAPQT